MIRKLLRSKYIRIALIVVVVAMIASGVIERPLPTKDHSPAKPPFTEAEWKEVEAKGVKTVVPFGEYKELWLVDGYRHLAAGKTWEGKIELMNFEDGRTVVVDGAEEYFEGPFGRTFERTGKYGIFKDKDDAYMVVDFDKTMESGKVVRHPAADEKYENAWFDNNGKYLALVDEKYNYVYDSDGNLLYQNKEEEGIYNERVGYSLEGSEEKGYSIKNLITGETEYRLKANEEVDGYRGGHWIILKYIDDEVEYYLMNDDFQINKKIGKCITGESNEKYFAVYNKDSEIILNSEGKIVHTRPQSERSKELIGFFGDTAAFRSGYSDPIDYVHLAGDKKGQTEARDDLCMMDFEDGIGMIILPKPGNTLSPWDIGLVDVRGANDVGFVDRNFNHITDFIFDEACTSENGYAVVKKDGNYAILDLKGAI